MISASPLTLVFMGGSRDYMISASPLTRVFMGGSGDYMISASPLTRVFILFHVVITCYYIC